jgi:flagellar hook assembly protein FlgD
VLEPSYPNPFRAATRIDYSLPASTPVELAIYDVNGRVVRTLVSVERQPAGVYQVEWDGRNQAGLPVASGMYFYRLQAGDRLVDSRMMVRIR